MASFSNNELTVSALLSFSIVLWIRSDNEKQNIIKQTYFKIFKEPQLKDENYRRKWFFEPTKKNKIGGLLQRLSRQVLNWLLLILKRSPGSSNCLTNG